MGAEYADAVAPHARASAAALAGSAAAVDDSGDAAPVDATQSYNPDDGDDDDSSSDEEAAAVDKNLDSRVISNQPASQRGTLGAETIWAARTVPETLRVNCCLCARRRSSKYGDASVRSGG